MNTMNAYDRYEYASFDTLKSAFVAGELTEKQTKVLLVRKGYELKGVRYLLKDWKAMRAEGV
jgi:hypothetical protein